MSEVAPITVAKARFRVTVRESGGAIASTATCDADAIRSYVLTLPRTLGTLQPGQRVEITRLNSPDLREASREAEDGAWTDAYRILNPGACNAGAVARTLSKRTLELGHLWGMTPAREHPAMRAIAAHLAYLYGLGLGPSADLLHIVDVQAKRLGLISSPED